MRFLADLGIAHGAALAPNGAYVLTFPHVEHAAKASALLTAGGYRVNSAGPRGLLATAPVRPSFNERHAVLAKRLKVSILFMIFPVFYVSVPLYTVLVVRWYRRTRPSLPRLPKRQPRAAHARYI
jgi:hypothetical protein